MHFAEIKNINSGKSLNHCMLKNVLYFVKIARGSEKLVKSSDTEAQLPVARSLSQTHVMIPPNVIPEHFKSAVSNQL